MEYYRRSLAMAREMHDKLNEGVTLLDLGGIYQRTRDWDAALDSFRKAQAIFEEAHIKDAAADCPLSIGIVYQHRHQFAEAREQFLKALAMNQETGEQERIGESLDNLANVDNDLGQPARALESSTRACEIAHQMNDRANIMSCRTSMGESYSLLHQPVQARAAFEEAITALESMRKDVVGGAQQQQAFLDPSSSTPYHDMVKLLLEENQLADAFSYIEREKARALLDVIRSGHESLDKVLTDADRDTQQQLRLQLASFSSQMDVESDNAKLADLKSQRDTLRLKLEDFETGLYARYPELSVHRGEAPITTLSQAAEMPFDDKTALLEFMVSDDETVLLVFTREGRDAQWSISAYPIKVDMDALGEQTRAFRSQVAARQLGFQAPARHLYNLLVRPAAEQLKGKTALIIVPDGTLWNLPFQSLLDTSGHYLLERFAIAYAPSLTVMREMMNRRTSESPQEKSPRFLAMANPAFAKQTDDRGAHRGSPFAPLPNAEEEAKALAQLYGTGNSRVYTGEQATISRFKAEAGSFSVVHLATHGFTSDSSPMYSSVLLSPGSQQDDGLLEAREIMNLDLHAKLVVLSACETARGRVGEGEGMIGLTWAFFAAGVPSIVASEWKVDSESTTKLMLAFHRDLKQQRGAGLAIARSLQEAALKLLHDPQYAHPFYWSAFVVVGDPN
jgi:CHAT domain-containing protein